MEPIEAGNISVVTDVLDAEREALLTFLGGLNEDQWQQPTECPAWPVKGIATHTLGDDLSLVLVAEQLPGADFRTLLDAFNDQWVEAARFLSPDLLVELLRLSGQLSSAYYREVDPTSPGEPVPLFDPAAGDTSPFWQAIAREYLERWAHQSQIRRALGRPSLADEAFLTVGVQIVATAAGAPAEAPTSADGDWAIGPLVLGPAQQTADILTLAHTAPEVQSLVDGPPDLVALFASRLGRRSD